ncbi:unnamed protein product [Eruca vesicaria subsp. sativa]|uniref:RRM domain-containing protein n=1 Tax=Eruca vesicaria subsp. sativa TaxID=29727 RepID=A0ABC8LBH5_ERUVS|nr:unnamed protein product [Eruca vesicaria subsp. sativa]
MYLLFEETRDAQDREYKDLAIVHYRWVKKVNDEKEVDNEEPKSESKLLEGPAKQRARLAQEWREEEARRTLHLSNLCFNVSENDIAKFFDGVGHIRDIRMTMRKDGIFKSYAFVEFDSAESAQDAMKLHHKPMLNRPVHLARAYPRGPSAGVHY